MNLHKICQLNTATPMMVQLETSEDPKHRTLSGLPKVSNFPSTIQMIECQNWMKAQPKRPARPMKKPSCFASDSSTTDRSPRRHRVTTRCDSQEVTKHIPTQHEQTHAGLPACSQTPVVWKHIQKQVKEVQKGHKFHIILLPCGRRRSMVFHTAFLFAANFPPFSFPRTRNAGVRPAAKVSSDPLPQRRPRRSRSATALVKMLQD